MTKRSCTKLSCMLSWSAIGVHLYPVAAQHETCFRCAAVHCNLMIDEEARPSAEALSKSDPMSLVRETSWSDSMADKHIPQSRILQVEEAAEAVKAAGMRSKAVQLRAMQDEQLDELRQSILRER